MQGDEKSEENAMDLFNAWFSGVDAYVRGVENDLQDHPDPARYCQEMSDLITEERDDANNPGT